jgi:uncharacterized membrane protein
MFPEVIDMNTIVNFLVEQFGANGSIFSKEVLVFVISLCPILELRGGLLAASILGLDAFTSYILCVIGNILPVPFILWFIETIFHSLKKTRLKNIVFKMEEKAHSKRKTIEKYGYFGLVLFVGIPFPGTGAWTGSLIAVLLGMDKKKSFLATLVGIIMASIIMMLISFGILKIWI